MIKCSWTIKQGNYVGGQKRVGEDWRLVVEVFDPIWETWVVSLKTESLSRAPQLACRVLGIGDVNFTHWGEDSWDFWKKALASPCFFVERQQLDIIRQNMERTFEAEENPSLLLYEKTNIYVIRNDQIVSVRDNYDS